MSRLIVILNLQKGKRKGPVYACTLSPLARISPQVPGDQSIMGVLPPTEEGFLLFLSSTRQEFASISIHCSSKYD